MGSGRVHADDLIVPVRREIAGIAEPELSAGGIDKLGREVEEVGLFAKVAQVGRHAPRAGERVPEAPLEGTRSRGKGCRSMSDQTDQRSLHLFLLA